MDIHALTAATLAMAVLMALAAWFDLKELRIPNWCVLAVIAVYLVTGLWGLPFDIFAWRLAHGVIVLFIGFGLYSISGGNVGGGDIKMIAALTPFVAGNGVGFVFLTFALASIVGLFLHRIARKITAGRTTGWAALDQKRFFPAGLLLGATIMIYLGVELVGLYSA